ncbi:MazG nucleotide pyrophosphohydrolase [Rippkaea orientalis PCC 8801]|uniref:MazG nucleotide pyrophosphohydrolase n=1 Tax=Rippkaea orientalis (strain PCC 8801 / RF-1) TaxID=41431 RepID=B7JWE8_RIPO1|nr:nucleoside triphosphate pyrophosphohydrolase [Rippkaea orientalis]ACK66993.1 MazG nucleotide pyrophosphohydrolase [Rippkaea orientalis PCC 8801]
MRQYHHKLVRDKIPDIIAKSENFCEIRTLSEQEYLEALKHKLLEEAQEVIEADPENLVKELGDLFEVIDNILIAYQISRETVINYQQQRRKERGGFTQRIQLIWTETQAQ